VLDPSSPEALAWLAGFLDGEGHFNVERMDVPRLDLIRSIRYYPYISVNHTDEQTLHAIIHILGALNLGDAYQCGWYRNNTYPVRKDRWFLRVRGYHRCMRWLDILVPHLRTKLAEARLVHEYCSLGLGAYHAKADMHEYSARELQLLALLGVPNDFSVRPIKRVQHLPCFHESIYGFPPRSPQEDIAWLAGFFDAEGSIALWETKQGWRKTDVVLPNTHMPSLPYVRQILDTNDIVYRCLPSRKLYYKKEQSPQWRVDTQGRPKSIPWLSLMIPYLITRKEKAVYMVSEW
jgi:hypothetical protein